jgi:hypothetical protein
MMCPGDTEIDRQTDRRISNAFWIEVTQTFIPSATALSQKH